MHLISRRQYITHQKFERSYWIFICVLHTPNREKYFLIWYVDDIRNCWNEGTMLTDLAEDWRVAKGVWREVENEIMWSAFLAAFEKKFQIILEKNSLKTQMLKLRLSPIISSDQQITEKITNRNRKPHIKRTKDTH